MAGSYFRPSSHHVHHGDLPFIVEIVEIFEAFGFIDQLLLLKAFESLEVPYFEPLYGYLLSKVEGDSLCQKFNVDCFIAEHGNSMSGVLDGVLHDNPICGHFNDALH